MKTNIRKRTLALSALIGVVLAHVTIHAGTVIGPKFQNWKTTSLAYRAHVGDQDDYDVWRNAGGGVWVNDSSHTLHNAEIYEYALPRVVEPQFTYEDT